MTTDPRSSSVVPLRLCILGSTGSIGRNTLDVISRHPDRFEVFALTAQQRADELLAQCARWRPRYAAMPDAARAAELARRLAAEGIATIVLSGVAALAELAAHDEVDVVMAAIVGAAGLAPCMAAALAGKRVLLANKEALVVGGALFVDAVKEGGATLLPVDSEHSAIFQCLPEDRAHWNARVERIVLTASGGPFREREASTLASVTPDEACAHPNWVMGRKISVDSATMMNKALEVIEARWLFGIAPERIEVVVHPQSIVHSMVVCRDGSVLAQLGVPDMRVPIAYGLSYPERIESGTARLEFSRLDALTFSPPDAARFPGLSLAWDVLRGEAGGSVVLNAANEEAVAAFLDGGIRFDDIHRVNTEALAGGNGGLSEQASLDDLLALDALARDRARAVVRRLAR